MEVSARLMKYLYICWSSFPLNSLMSFSNLVKNDLIKGRAG